MTEALRVTDAIPLPEPGELVTGRATREDAYPIVVCRTFEDAISRVVGWLGGSAVAVITDDVVEALYGSTLVRGLRAAGKAPLVRVMPGRRGEQEPRRGGRRVALARRVRHRPPGRPRHVRRRRRRRPRRLDRERLHARDPVRQRADDAARAGRRRAGRQGRREPPRRRRTCWARSTRPQASSPTSASCERPSARHLRAGLAEAIKKAVIASPGRTGSSSTSTPRRCSARDLDALERLVHCARPRSRPR